MANVSLNLLVLKTNQVENALVFYQTLGIAFVKEQHGKGPVHYAGKLGEMVFEIYPMTGDGSVDVAVRLGFEVPKLTETIEALRAIGMSIISEPKVTDWGTRAVVRDPDGRAVELYQQYDAEVERHGEFCGTEARTEPPCLKAARSALHWATAIMLSGKMNSADAGRYGSSTVSRTAAKRGQSHP
jgi:lactoylglutathione lyase